MRQITITLPENLWLDVLVDLDSFESELDAGLFDDTNTLEPGSYQLQRELDYRGVTL